MAKELEQSCSKQQRWSFQGMTALVTGGTKGIGYAIVEELAGFGATIYTCSRNEGELNERLREWEVKGFKVKGSVCDLSIRTQREELINKVSAAFDGKLNILVNNAGMTIMKRATDYTADDFARIMGTNLEPPYHICQLAHPLLKASGMGTIIFTFSEEMGRVAEPEEISSLVIRYQYIRTKDMRLQSPQIIMQSCRIVQRRIRKEKRTKNKLCSIIGRTRSSPMTRSSHTITETAFRYGVFQLGRVP
ncbi:hypothetical protein OROMI_011999 [Orobanche minor]